MYEYLESMLIMVGSLEPVASYLFSTYVLLRPMILKRYGRTIKKGWSRTDGVNPTGFSRPWSTKGNFSGVLSTSFLIHNNVKTVPPSSSKKSLAYS